MWQTSELKGFFLKPCFCDENFLLMIITYEALCKYALCFEYQFLCFIFLILYSYSIFSYITHVPRAGGIGKQSPKF